MSRLFGRSEPKSGELSAYDAERLKASLAPLLAGVNTVSWYDELGSDVDVATARLCLLRRARAGASGSAEAGDEAVRLVLNAADNDVVVWLLSRAISYMDEQGFPDHVPGAWPQS
jgi:hypothetical protein